MTAAKIRKALDRLSSVLDSLYDSQLKRIQAKDLETQDLALKALAWVLYAVRPLTVTELLEALAVEDWQTKRDPENYINIEVLLYVCNGLITIQDSSNTVHFSHYTVQQYLLAQCERIPSPLQLAKACLTYLLLEECTVQSPKSTEQICAIYPFLYYSAVNWTHHLKGEPLDVETMERVKELLTSRCKFESMLRIGWVGYTNDVNKDSSISNEDLPIPNCLHFAVRTGLASVASLILDGQWSGDDGTEGIDGRFAVHQACMGSNLEIVRRLVERDIHAIHTRDHNGRTPLHYSVRGGNLQVLEFLLENGADTLLEDHSGQNALSVAMSTHKEETTRIIFDHMFKTDTRRWLKSQSYYEGTTFLHYAASQGHEDAVEGLLKAGADPHRPDIRGYTALHSAAMKGHQYIVAMLLQAMDNSVKPSSLKITPLHIASTWGHEMTVSVLLSAGQNADAKDCLTFTPLHWAIIGGHAGVLRRLFSETNIQMPEGRSIPTLFQLAWWGGDKEIIDLIRGYYFDKGGNASTLFTWGVDMFPHHFEMLANCFSPEMRLSQVSGAIMLCDTYGLRQLRKGSLKCASAWFDLSVILHPDNMNEMNSANIIYHKKGCDSCGMQPIKGRCYTCIVCFNPCYDLCQTCFEKRGEHGHRHSRYIGIPSAQGSLPGLSEHCDILRFAMQEQQGYSEIRL